MKSFYILGGLIAGILTAVILAEESRPHSSGYSIPIKSSSDISDGHDKSVQNTIPATVDADHEANVPVQGMSPGRQEAGPVKSRKQNLIDAIRSALRSGDGGLMSQVSTNEFRQLIENDPQAASDFIQELDPGLIREQWLRQLAHGWATQDSAGAVAWAANLAGTEDRSSALADVCLQMSQLDPKTAIGVAIQYGLSNQSGLLENMMQQWATQDPAAALDWADQLPAGSDRDGMMSRLAFAEAEISPIDAAKLVVYEIPPGSNQEEAALSVLHQWALQDFAGASTWADQFEDDAFRDRAKRELAGIEAYRRALNN